MADTAQTDMVSATGSAEGGFLLSTLQSMANWCRKNSCWPLPLYELALMTGSHLQAIGITLSDASPSRPFEGSPGVV
jgi:hypothetical protein